MPLQSTSGAASYDAFGGGAAAVPNYIEQVFSTHLYTGNGGTQTITNKIDLSTEGGLVWLKDRNSGAKGHGLYDTNRGVNLRLQSQSTNGQLSAANQLTAFNLDGFSLGSDGDGNGSGTTYVSWTFRKQPKFFDIVTYTGNGDSGLRISHNLGSVPGCIIWKRTDTTSPWGVWHIASNITSSRTGASLNATDGFAYTTNGTTLFTSTYFQPSFINAHTGEDGNTNGGTYVAYIFAHDAGGFGLTGLDNVISCGSFDGAANTTVTLGYEPQWIMFKNTTSTSNWQIIDNMRGMPVGSDDRQLMPNLSNAESDNGLTTTTATGFTWLPSAAGNTYIYIAIRRGPMKVPTSGTEVYKPIARTSTGSATKVTGVGFTPDASLIKRRDNTANNVFVDRLRGRNLLRADNTGAEIAASSAGRDLDSFDMDGISIGTNWNVDLNAGGGATYIDHFFRRAPGFFDEVCYTGNSTNNRQLPHNLGVIPELVFHKSRSDVTIWYVWVNGVSPSNYCLILNMNLDWSAYNTGLQSSTSTNLNLSTSSGEINITGQTYVAYLFATCAGVSKVGSYTGTGTTLQIDCGFTGGARFVLIKRTDSTGDWYVWDSARGIVAGNDPYLLFNSTAAEVTNTDYVDTYSAGFEISSTAPAAINASGGSFIFLAIA